MTVPSLVRLLRAPAVAVATTAALAVPGASAGAAPDLDATRAAATVEVAHLAFTPRTVSVPLGDDVLWSFPEAMTHTTTSDDGFWDSGSRSGGATYSRTFGSAGTFAYHCTFHPSMRGKIRVSPAVAGAPETGWRLRWATGKVGTRTFDVQTRRGSGRWRPFRSDTTRPAARFDPARAGSYQVRVRTLLDSGHSGWSPVLTLPVR